MKRALTLASRYVGFAAIAVVLAYCIHSAFDPPRLNWGDSASDYNAMTAGRNFQKYGFWKMHLTPVVLDAELVRLPEDRAMIYTHYPQLPDLMNGVLRVAFRLSDIVQFRFVALAFSFASLFFIYQLLCAYWTRPTAQLAIALWVINPLWIQHADYLHHLPYAAFFGFGSMYFLVRYLREGKRGWLAASGAFLFLTILSSYDYWFFAPLLIALITFEHYRAIRRPLIQVLGVLAACTVAAALCKWATNAWALGGVQAFIHDLRFQATERATDKTVKLDYNSGMWATLTGRVERCFTLLLFPITLFWALAPLLRRRYPALFPADRRLPNPLLVLAAALPFLILFRELWIGQYYPTLLVVPFYAIASAALVTLLVGQQRTLARVGGGLLFAVLVFNSYDETANFRKAFFDRDAIRALNTQLDSVSRPGQQILSNHVFDAAYRYYVHKNTIAMILFRPQYFAGALTTYSDPKLPRFAPPGGAIFVEHKRLPEELYDKGYYYILGRAGLWGPWGNPRRYQSELDEFIAKRDSELMAQVAQDGDRIYDTPFYAIWRLRPSNPAPAAGMDLDGAGATKH